MPALNTVNCMLLFSTMCDIEIPTAVIDYNLPMIGMELVTPLEVKTVFWGGVLYRRFSQLPPVT